MVRSGPTRGNLLVRFSLLSAACVLLLGLGLGRYLERQIEHRALQNAGDAAELLADEAVRPQLRAGDLRRGAVPAPAARRLAGIAASAKADGRLARVKVWTRGGRVAWSDDRRVIGRRFRVADDLREAFAGERHLGVANGAQDEQRDERALGKLVEVYVPLHLAPGGRPVGAFEIYTPYAPVAAAIRHDTRAVYGLLGAGLLALWLVLFRIVWGASRTLRSQAARYRHDAGHDELTGLPNRRALSATLRATIAQAERDEGGCGLLLLDLDGFKELNDTLGHDVGDELLRELGRRLAEVIDGRAEVARLGGDEFAVALPAGSRPETAWALATELRAVLRRPFSLDGMRIVVDASIGIACFPEHAGDAGSLLRHADVAMYQAKRMRTGVEEYDVSRDGSSRHRLELVGELREGIAADQLVVHYQPKCRVTDGVPAGVEALVRWQHPERGLLPPGAFIDLAERAGLIRALTLRVLERALFQLRAWSAMGYEMTVAVNLSAAGLLDSRLPADIEDRLAAAGVRPDRLVLEITENTVMSDPPRARAVLEQLAARGIGLSLDDFGTGYSSLAHLRTLPVGEMKIDRSFVGRMDEVEDDAAIVRSTVELGRALGLRVVAEGVETAETLERLRGFGCDLAQGYVLSRPVPAAELTEWLRAQAAQAVARA
jgi:diguanylate cyclase (GGDEF)-like protein